MELNKFVNAFSLGQARADRMKRIRAKSTKLVFSDLGFELEKRQLLATFSYSSGLLTIQTNSANEELSIISTSESGNYTLTTSGSWSGSPVSGLSNTSTSLYVNQPSGLASILINDNNGTVSNSWFSFGSSSANFVTNLTVNFTNSTAGEITVANPISFIGGKSVSLTTTKNLIHILSPISAKSNGSIILTGRTIQVTGNPTDLANLASAIPITTESGDIILTGNSSSFLTGGYKGIQLDNANLTSISGNIVIDGQASSDGDYGVYINGEVYDITGDPIPNCRTSILETGGQGNISITGVIGDAINPGSSGVFLNTIIVQTNNGSFAMNGLLNSSSFISVSSAVRFSGSNFTSSGSGNFNMSGNTTANGDDLRGAIVDRSTIHVSSGSVNITGDNYAGGNLPQGAYFLGSTIRSNGSGNISVSGTNYNNSTNASAAIYGDGSNLFENTNGTIAINGISYDQNTTLTPCGVYLKNLVHPTEARKPLK